jgi:predicted TIM-barrel fold metal-dependent hydrolase
MTDYHTHIGQFYDIYTSPEDFVRIMDAVKMERFACSSTTICEGKYDKVLAEMSEMLQLAGNRFLPVLWITPKMLRNGELQRFLDNNIPWKMLKIHPQLHPLAWHSNSKNLQKVIQLAKKMSLPLLIHTGEFAGCYPSLFEKAIRNNPSVTFILAHGRPLEETLTLMQRYPNVLTDTAFMPIEQIAKICATGLTKRILWGTDIPIQLHYNQNENLIVYYQNRMKEVRETIRFQDYNTIMGNHFYLSETVISETLEDAIASLKEKYPDAYSIREADPWR